MTMTAVGRASSFVLASICLSVLTLLAAPAEAQCVGSKCATTAKTAESHTAAGKAADSKSASVRKSSAQTVRVAKPSQRTPIASPLKRSLERTAVVASTDVENLPVKIADARAEMVAAGSEPAASAAGSGTTEPAAAIRIVSSEELNELDEAATDSNGLPAALANARAEMREDRSSPWGQTSMIGKAFIVIGVMLTLASAARLLVA